MIVSLVDGAMVMNNGGPLRKSALIDFVPAVRKLVEEMALQRDTYTPPSNSASPDEHDEVPVS